MESTIPMLDAADRILGTLASDWYPPLTDREKTLIDVIGQLRTFIEDETGL